MTVRRAAILLALMPVAGLVLAQGVPPAAPRVGPVAANASAGTYALDTRHASVIARIGHGGGSSLSTFRFGTATGSLTWDPARPQASRVTVTVDVASIMTPVPGFAAELMEPRFLDTGRYPQATFVSTAIQPTGPTAGRITGDLTFMGRTRPVVVDARLVGAGAGARGATVIGFSGTTRFKRSDFGFIAGLPGIGDEVELLLDLEFNRPGTAPAAAPPPR